MDERRQGQQPFGVGVLKESEVVIDLTAEPATVTLRDHTLQLSAEPEPLWKRTVVRTIDLVIATGMLIALAPLFVVLAIAVKLTSRGPIFYASTRLGIRGSEFCMYKFRSMVPGAETLVLPGGELESLYLAEGFKIKDDPRVTKIGRFMRRTSLDELPQLVNVLRGHMGICGPRPKTVSEGQAYGAALPVVLRIRPGLTGRWQVSGRSDIPFDERIMMEIDYALNRTVREDAGIILRTGAHMVGQGDGAY